MVYGKNLPLPRRHRHGGSAAMDISALKKQYYSRLSQLKSTLRSRAFETIDS